MRLRSKRYKMKITNDVLYIGVNDHDVDLFEGQYVVPNGMAYNSYVIIDEKIAVMEGVSFQAISTSIRKAEKNLKIFLNIFYFSPDFFKFYTFKFAIYYHSVPFYGYNPQLPADNIYYSVIVYTRSYIVVSDSGFG